MKSPFKRSKNRRTNDARVTLADVETDEGVDERRQWKRGRAEGGGGGAVFVEEAGEEETESRRGRLRSSTVVCWFCCRIPFFLLECFEGMHNYIRRVTSTCV